MQVRREPGFNLQAEFPEGVGPGTRARESMFGESREIVEKLALRQWSWKAHIRVFPLTM